MSSKKLTIEWRDVVGYEGLYMVSSCGKIMAMPKMIYREGDFFGVKNERILPQFTEKFGYVRVGLMKNLDRRKVFVHRIIAKAFIPNPNNYPCINHMNCVKADNRIENLEWCTYAQNNQHMYDNGRQPKFKPRKKLISEKI